MTKRLEIIFLLASLILLAAGVVCIYADIDEMSGITITSGGTFAGIPATVSVSGGGAIKGGDVDDYIRCWDYEMTNSVGTLDVSGGNYTATSLPTVANGPVYSNINIGASSYCYYFDGSDDKFKMSNTNMDFSGDFSVSLWINTGTVQANSSFMLSCSGPTTSPSSYGWDYLLLSAGKDQCLVLRTADGIFATGSGGTNLADNVWHHIAMVVDRDDVVTYYVDGGLDGSTQDISGYQQQCASVGYCSIGEYRGSVANDMFVGLMDDVRIYDRLLSAGEVATIYANRK